jgi:hypothetical protein
MESTVALTVAAFIHSKHAAKQKECGSSFPLFYITKDSFHPIKLRLRTKYYLKI